MMRNLPQPYVADHPICRTIIAAVAEGLGKVPIPAGSVSWRPEPAIVYGILRGSADIIRKCEQADIDWWHIDHGYWGRGHFDGYYRLSLRSQQQNKRVGPPARNGIEIPRLSPWRCGSGPILLCPPTLFQQIYHPLDRIDVDDWIDTTTRAIEALTDKSVLVRPKEGHGSDLREQDPWCIVVHSSNIAIDALVMGIPAIALGESAVKNWGPRLCDIDNRSAIRNIDRELLLFSLSHSQFTLDEFREGLPWALLNA